MNIITKLMSELEEEELLAKVKEVLESGEEPATVFEQCREGMSIVGQRFEKGEYFLSELIMAGEVFKQVGEVLNPYLSGKAGGAPKGKVIIGTVKDDIHDLGKNIVVTMLKSANYEVEDVGEDVPPERFVEAVKKTGVKIVGLSCLLTSTIDNLTKTIEALKEEGLDVKVMIGGGPITEDIKKQVGADALGKNAQEAVSICDRWIKEPGVI